MLIRAPGVETVSRPAELLPDYAQLRYEIAAHGTGVVLLALGRFFPLGQQTAELLKAKGCSPTLINPRCVNDVDADALNALRAGHRLAVTLEDGVLDGGFGEQIARFYGGSAMKVLSFGAERRFVDWTPQKEQYERYGLTAEKLAAPIMETLEKGGSNT